jgi:hypothetical protein
MHEKLRIHLSDVTLFIVSHNTTQYYRQQLQFRPPKLITTLISIITQQIVQRGEHSCRTRVVMLPVYVLS